jgi:hypothetical protein
MKKYTFKFKKPEFLLDGFVISDSVITTSEDKAWEILNNSYDTMELEAEIISVEDIILFSKENTCNTGSNVVLFN